MSFSSTSLVCVRIHVRKSDIRPAELRRRDKRLVALPVKRCNWRLATLVTSRLTETRLQREHERLADFPQCNTLRGVA